MNNVKSKVIRGLAWTYAERILAQVVSLVVTVILARILSPSDYGVISIVVIFISLADTFAVNGLGNSLIQKKNSDQLDFSSVFYFNIVFSIFIYLVLFFLAKPVGNFYKMESLPAVLRVMAIRIPIAAINSVQQAYVSKRMEFKKFFFSTLGGTIVSAIIGIVMAYTGFGVWALVGQYLTNTAIDTIVLWFSVRWRPSFCYSSGRMKGLFSYGWKVLVTSLLITIHGDLQNLIIGKKYTPQDLAYSEKGRQFPALIASNINTSISKVLFPAVSEFQDNIASVKSMTRRAIGVGTYLLSPILFGMFAIADNLVSVLLTDKWVPCVPYLRILCIVFWLQPIQTASIQAMKALGKSGMYLRLEIIKKIFGVIILLTTVLLSKSVLLIIIGSLISEVISTLINWPTNKKLLSYTYMEQLVDIAPASLISIIMALCCIGGSYLVSNKILALAVQVIIGVIVYLFLSVVVKDKNYIYIKDTIRGIVQR